MEDVVRIKVISDMAALEKQLQGISKSIVEISKQLDKTSTSMDADLSKSVKSLGSALKTVQKEMGTLSGDAKKLKGDMNFLGVGFLGMQIQRTFQGILTSGVETFLGLAAGTELVGDSVAALSANFNYFKFLLGSILLSVLEPFIQKGIALLEWFTSLDSGTQKVIVGFMAFFTAAGFLLSQLGFLVIGFQSLLAILGVTEGMGVAGALAKVGSMLGTGSIILLGLWALYEAVKLIAPAFKELEDALGLDFKNVDLLTIALKLLGISINGISIQLQIVAGLLLTLGYVTGTIINFIVNQWIFAITNIGNYFKLLYEGIKILFYGLIKVILDPVETILNKLANLVRAFASSTVGRLFSEFTGIDISGVADGFDAAAKSIGSFDTKIKSSLVNAKDILFDMGKSYQDIVGSGLKTDTERIITLWETLSKSVSTDAGDIKNNFLDILNMFKSTESANGLINVSSSDKGFKTMYDSLGQGMSVAVDLVPTTQSQSILDLFKGTNKISTDITRPYYDQWESAASVDKSQSTSNNIINNNNTVYINNSSDGSSVLKLLLGEDYYNEYQRVSTKQLAFGSNNTNPNEI